MRWHLSATLTLLLLAACTATPAPPSPVLANPYEAERRAGITSLLTQWATALRTNDQQQLARLMDPKAPPEFTQAQRERAQNLHGVPLREWGFSLADGPETPLPAELADSLGAGDTWSGPVELRYAIAGADPVPTRQPLTLTVARRGDQWLLVSAAPTPGRSHWLGPWDFGPLAAIPVPVAGGRTAVVLGHPAQRGELDALAAELPDAVRAINEVWGSGWAGTALVLVAGNDAEFAQLAGTSALAAGKLTDTAAVAVADALTPGKPPSGQRVVFAPGAVTRLSAADRRAILRHEITHIATREVTVASAPPWLVEGFADYIGYRGQAVRDIAPGVALSPPAALPGRADFSDPARAQQAYEISWAACAFVAASSGEAQLVRLYRRGASEPHADVLRDVLGISEPEFRIRWHEWLRGQR